MSLLNKDAQTLGKRQYHIHLSPGDVGKYVLLPGDPKRSDIVAEYLNNPKLVGDNREHRTFTGTYKGITISSCSTGMGCPSTAIACEELINIGAENLIRIGSTGALQKNISIGDLVISTGAMKNEGTSRFYVPDCFPAVPDFNLTRALIEAAEDLQAELGYELHYGICASDDAFYGETPEWIEKLSKLGCLNVDMESSAIYTVCHRRGKRGATVNAVSGNLITADVIYETKNERLYRGWEDSIQVILEAIVRLEQNDVGRKA